MASDILSPLTKLPGKNRTTVLLVGEQGVGKHQLAGILSKLQAPFQIHVHTATRLPLPSVNSDDRPNVDLVVFIIDATNRKSLKTVEESALKLDVNFFLGKTCFLITKVEEFRDDGVPIDYVTQLADQYDSPLFTADFQTEAGKRVIANQILHKVKVAAGMCPAVSPLLVDSTRQNVQLLAM